MRWLASGDSVFTAVMGALIAGIMYLLGGWNVALETLLVMMALDYATGIIAAIHTKNLSSRIGALGILKKVGYLVMIMAANMVDRLTGAGGGVHTIVIYFFVANEGISLVENWERMGLPIPSVLRGALEQVRKRGK